MKHINLILSVLFWAIASVSMAVTLPSSSYDAFESVNFGNESYTLGVGVTFKNSSLLSTGYEPSTTSDVACTVAPSTSDEEAFTYCSECCTNNVFYSCLGELGDTEAAVSECEKRNASCVQACKDSRSLPLGSSLLLLPFALAYALVRRRRQVSEQA